MASHSPRRLRVLLLEDNALIARFTARLLEKAGCEVVGPVATLADSQRLLEEDRPDLALVDLTLPDGSGETLIHQLKEMGIECAVYTGAERPAQPSAIMSDLPWLEKPLTLEKLRHLTSKVEARLRIDPK
jgi:DNA-binding response OmpR family regulator